MFTRIRLAGLFVLAVTSAILAVAPPPRPLGPTQVQQLIDQLGDRDYRVREQAERTLQGQGMIALPHLRKALAHKDPEIRRRALRMVPGLEHAALVAPRRISLIIRNQPLKVVLDEMSKQTGYKIMNNSGGMILPAVMPGAVPGKAPSGEPRYSFTFLNTTFWEAMEQVCRAANLSVQQGWGDEVVRLYHSGSQPPHVGHDGAFRYMASNMQLYRNVDLSTTNPGGASRNESLTFNFVLFAEPRLPFLGMNEVRLEAAYDSERNSMLPPANPNAGHFEGPWAMGISRRYYGGGYKQMNLHVSLQLNRVSEKAASVKLLKGVVPVILLVETRPIVLADKILSAKGKKTTTGDVEFTIDNVQKMPNNQYQIKFTATNKAGTNDYTWMNTVYQRLELRDDKGNKYQNWGTNWHGGGGNNVSMTLTYSGQGVNKIGAPAKFIYQHWVTRQHDIHFEFRNVPLP